MKQAEFYDANLGGTNDAARVDSETIFVRVFNNFIKTLLIQEYSFAIGGPGATNLSVLDLCCGKGGDLKKWSRQRIAHYVGCDLSPNLVNEAQRRYNEMHNDRRPGFGGGRSTMFKAIFMVNDAGPLDTNNSIDNVLA